MPNILDSLVLFSFVPWFNPKITCATGKIQGPAAGDCYIFKFLQRVMDGKQVIRFQSENTSFKFLWHSVHGSLINVSSSCHQNVRYVLVLHQKCAPYLLFPYSNLHSFL